MIARKVDDHTSRVFVAPIKGAKRQQAAAGVGLTRAAGMFSLRIEGPDQPGLGARITSAVAEKGVNLRGASAAAVGKKAVFYLAVEGERDLKEATRAVRKVLGR
jgi:UTP:GlnB (protein PII) uridylyltransferase